MKVKIELPGYETEELVPYSSLTKVYGVLQCLKRKHIENISKYTLYNPDSVALDPLRTLSSYNNIPVPLFLPFFLSSFPFFLSSSPSFPLFPLLFPLLPPFFALFSFSLLLFLFSFSCFHFHLPFPISSLFSVYSLFPLPFPFLSSLLPLSLSPFPFPLPLSPSPSPFPPPPSPFPLPLSLFPFSLFPIPLSPSPLPSPLSHCTHFYLPFFFVILFSISLPQPRLYIPSPLSPFPYSLSHSFSHLIFGNSRKKFVKKRMIENEKS